MLMSRQRELRNELHGRIRSVRTEGSERNRGLDPDDTSDITVQDDLQFALIELKAEMAKKIDVALRRLEEGTYGLCLECGDEIAESRLRALPFAARCKECEEAIEMSQERDRAQARRASSPLLATFGLVIAFAFAATAAFAQTPAANTTQPSGDAGRSAAAMAQEASNPFASSWALQLQQNNNWAEVPFGDDRVQSNLQFQPLLSMRLTEKQGLIIRPIVTVVNSVPHLDQSGQNDRTAGFGDTVLAFALPRSLFGGRLMVGAGPTFIFPTASQDLLSQDNWQVGPDAGAVLLGKKFISYGFVQQWFKVGGGGADTNQMNGTFNFTYLLDNGWTIGTQPTLSVDWKALDGEQGTFGIGPQVGKMCRCGGLPTLFQVQVQVLPDSSKRRRSDLEHSAASDANDSGIAQESAVLTRGPPQFSTGSVNHATNRAARHRADPYRRGTPQRFPRAAGRNPQCLAGARLRTDQHRTGCTQEDRPAALGGCGRMARRPAAAHSARPTVTI